jgi:hypothetical protein
MSPYTVYYLMKWTSLAVILMNPILLAILWVVWP